MAVRVMIGVASHPVDPQMATSGLLIFAVEIGENKRLLEIKEEYCEYIIYV
jgi:hypothetical protein